MSLKEDFMRIANEIVAASSGRLRLAFNEDDSSTSKVADAAHFLKLDERRIGRDIELYGFMAKMMGDAAAVADFLAEVILPIQPCARSYGIGMDAMRSLAGVMPQDKRAEWLELLDSLNVPTAEGAQPS